MKEDLLKIILRAEEQYHRSIRDAVQEAEDYVNEQRQIQNDHILEAEQEWNVFEQQEADRLMLRLQKEEHEKEADMDVKRAELRARQALKIEQISDRLVKEVLESHGNC